MTERHGKERRSGLPGRRDYDGVCAVHTEVRRADLACMSQLKQGLHDMSEEIKSDKKDYVTKWTAGIITTVAMCFLSAIIALAGWQVKALSDGVKGLTDTVNVVSLKQSAVVAVQNRAVAEIKEMQQAQEKAGHERKELTSDIYDVKKQIDKLVTSDEKRGEDKGPGYSPKPEKRTGNND